MGMYRIKPVVVEARQLLGDDPMSIYRWVEENTQGSFEPYTDEVPASGVSIDPSTGEMLIATPEGVMRAGYGDWIVKGTRGEFYSCAAELFTQKYQIVEQLVQ